MKIPAVQTYLFFGGQCAAALQFYRRALGAKIDFQMKYSESPEPAPPGRLAKGWKNKLMHATFRIGGTMLMASDGCGPKDRANGVGLSISLPNEAAVKKTFRKLAAGGKVTLAPTKTFWSPCFGMVTDKFGIDWMVSVEGS
jgi:PhnB protein